MARISLPEQIPGMAGLQRVNPKAGLMLDELAQVLLRGESPLSPGERELIASYVSSQNECRFCAAVHSVVAGQLLRRRQGFVNAVLTDPETAPVSAKMKALLLIADRVRQGGQYVTDEDVALARQQGATDRDIHVTVLVAAAFSMYNRYLDGLAAVLPSEESIERTGKRLAADGYV